jgi:hypothetical protein
VRGWRARRPRAQDTRRGTWQASCGVARGGGGGRAGDGGLEEFRHRRLPGASVLEHPALSCEMVSLVAVAGGPSEMRTFHVEIVQ